MHTYSLKQMYSVAAASIAAALLMGTMSISSANRPQSPVSALMQSCSIAPYSNEALKNMSVAFNTQANSLNKLGLGETKKDVCNALEQVNKAHAPAQSDQQFQESAGRARFLMGLATLYRMQQEPSLLTPGVQQVLARAFDVPKEHMAKWKAQDYNRQLVQYGIKAVRGQAALDSVSGVYPGDMQNESFKQFATEFQENNM